MFNRSAFATQLMRQARQQATRHFGSHGHGGAPKDTAYVQEYYARFKLPPIPKDGVYRRPRVDGNAHGPWQTNADGYMNDVTDMVPWFDRNSGASVSPMKAAKHCLMFAGTLFGLHSFGTFVIGDENSPDISGSTHPGAIHQLISSPHMSARQLVVEMI